MKTSKSFVKKTKKGAVLKVVREHYLRDDVWTCWKDDERTAMEKPLVNKDALQWAPSSLIFPFEHLILPDSNVVLHQVSFRVTVGSHAQCLSLHVSLSLSTALNWLC